MGYRKLLADRLFTGFELLLGDRVLITKDDGEIVTVTTVAEAGKDVEIFKGILTPGFINAHCHLELSHMKGMIPERTGLADFVYRVIHERQRPESEVIEAIIKSEAEMWQDGVVAIGDICNTALTLPVKIKHLIRYYNFIEASGWLPSLFLSRWEASNQMFERYYLQSLTASVVPHAPYSVSNDLWKKLSPGFAGKTISLHNQESNYENELFLKGSGDFLKLYEKIGIDNSFFLPAKISSIQSCFTNLSHAASVILVHNTFTSQDDISYILANKPAGQVLSFCLCPNANLYIENTLPPVDLFLYNGCQIVLGTDSLASNPSLSMLNEMKTIQHYFPSITLGTLLQWATYNGAKALQMEGSLGSFEAGKKPGVVLIENAEGELLPQHATSKRLL